MASSSTGPMASVKMMAEAVRAGSIDSVSLKRKLVEMVKGQTLEPKRKCLVALRSGLRAWHSLAVHVLDYPPHGSFPLRNVEEVVAYRAAFRCPGTPANYVGHIRFLSKLEGFGAHWDGPMLRVAMLGMAVQHLATVGSQVKVNFLLKWDMVA